MKVLLHYEDHENTAFYKTLKITLPKSWKTGPTSKLLGQFVESYNSNEALVARNPLQEDALHLAIREHDGDKSTIVPLASDAVTMEVIPDRADVYIMHGPSKTLQDWENERQSETKRKQDELANTVACKNFGCKKRFPRGGPYPDCRHHAAPPVFHETAKFWSCCPTKKAYDWEDFQNIPGCQTGTCTEIKEDDQKLFLGGSDMREKAGEAVKLKSIDDFNKSAAAGGADAAPVLERLENVLTELDIDRELFEQVVGGMKKEFAGKATNEAELLELVLAELGSKLKASFKTIAAEQQRIK
jgi:hypothetical protein